MIELVDRSAAEARGALIQIGGGRVADTILDDLLLGVTVAVSNALVHGRPPTTVRIWAAPDDTRYDGRDHRSADRDVCAVS